MKAWIVAIKMEVEAKDANEAIREAAARLLTEGTAKHIDSVVHASWRDKP